jgi:hypothetical protein
LRRRRRGRQADDERRPDMKSTILATLLLGAATTMASGQAYMVGTGLEPDETNIIYDRVYAEKFKIKREIVNEAQQIWGEAAAFETPAELPADVQKEIVPGQKLPEAAPVKDVPQEFSELPTLLDEGSHWMQTGDHLVEVTDDDQTIVMVVYNALP